MGPKTVYKLLWRRVKSMGLKERRKRKEKKKWFSGQSFSVELSTVNYCWEIPLPPSHSPETYPKESVSHSELWWSEEGAWGELVAAEECSVCEGCGISAWPRPEWLGTAWLSSSGAVELWEVQASSMQCQWSFAGERKGIGAGHWELERLPLGRQVVRDLSKWIVWECRSNLQRKQNRGPALKWE
jgi:hypothetical protein